MVHLLNAFSFLSSAADAGEPIIAHFAGSPLRCAVLPSSRDGRNGDVVFEVVKWMDRTGPPVAGAVVNLHARHQGAIHDFVATLVQAGLNYLVLSAPQFVRKVQRRAWVRVAPDPGAWVRVCDVDGVRRRSLLNLSAGGLGLLADEQDDDLAEGQSLGRLEFALDYGVFVRRGLVRRSARVDTRTGPALVVGVEFAGDDPMERDRLVAWVLRRERVAVLERRRDRLEDADLARGGHPR